MMLLKSDKDFSHKMMVRFRCGQRNDLPLVCRIILLQRNEIEREFVIF